VVLIVAAPERTFPRSPRTSFLHRTVPRCRGRRRVNSYRG